MAADPLELLQLREENRRLKAALQKAYKHRAELHAKLQRFQLTVSRECGQQPAAADFPNQTTTPGRD